MARPLENWLAQPNGLAARLRTARTRAGLQGKDLAERLGWAASKVSRIENGRQMPSRDDIAAWVAVCGIDEDEASELYDLASAAASIHLDWKRRLRRGQAAVQAYYNQLVAESQVVCHFATVLVPGLLQIRGYASHILRNLGREFGICDEDLEEAVTQRLMRQQMLYDTSKRFEFLVAEPVLRWVMVPPSVMRAQLDRLQTVIGMPNVRFGVLPLERRIHTIPQNSFVLYDNVAIVETIVGETTHEGEEAERYAATLARLWDDALEGADAQAAIIRAAADLPPDDEEA
jgi:transcriptional regulator with XRE-family HTH domain